MRVLQSLPIRVRPSAEEPAYALLNRLAIRHDASSVGEFLEQVYVKRANLAAHIRAGNRIEILAALVGVDPHLLAASTLRYGDGSTWLGDRPVSHSRPTHCLQFGRVCPACLEDDLEQGDGPEVCRPTRRTVWDIKPVLVCRTHRLLLVERCPACGEATGRHWLDPRRCPCGTAVGRSVMLDADLAGQLYLHRRVAGEAGGGGEFLDSLPVAHAGRAMLAIGKAWLFGRTWPSGADLDALQLAQASAAGFEALSRWPEGYDALLDQLDAQSESGTGRGAPHSRYGSLLHWLAYHGGPTFKELHKRLSDRYSLTGVATRHPFGREEAWVTVKALGLELGCWPLRIERIARYLGLEVVETLGPARVSPTSAKAIRSFFAAAAHGHRQGAERLGITILQFEKLHRAGLVANVLEGRHLLFDATALDALVRDCAGRARVIRKMSKGMMRLDQVTNLMRSLPSAIDALRSGQLACAGVLEAAPGLSSICLLEDRLKAIVPVKECRSSFPRWRRSQLP